jgi:hypothetical protein
MEGAKKIERLKKLTFKQKVTQTKDVKNCYQKGLQALSKKDKNKVKTGNSSLLEGSINLDECLKSKYPNDNRWDYIIGFAGIVYFVEIHPVKDDQVDIVKAKLYWLKNWKRNTPFKHDNNFYWLSSNGINISRQSRKYRQISQLGIRVRRISNLDKEKQT